MNHYFHLVYHIPYFFQLFLLLVFHTCNITLGSKTYVSLYSQSSNMLNQARLKALKVREDHVRNVLEEARRRLGEVTRNPSKYTEILNSLIVQGLLQVICWECYVHATHKVVTV